MVNLYDKSSHHALQMDNCNVTKGLQILERIQLCDKQTERQTDARGKRYVSRS